MAVRSYSGNAKTSAVSGTIAAAVTSIELADATGYPTGNDGPFVIAIDVGLANEEKVLVATRTGNTLTVASGGRGWDGTTAADHAAGAAVMHTFSATDAREANAHINATTAAHPATAISYAGSTDLVATNVEAALDELDAEKISTTAANAAYATKAEADSKVAKAGDTMTGGLTVDSGIASVRLRPQTAAVVSAESTTSTAFVGLATFGPAVTVETAASGRLRVSARAWLKNNTAGAASLIGVRVTRDTDNVVVVSPTDDLSAIAFSTSESSKELDLTYDLVANTRYRVELNYRVNSGTGTFQYRRLTAQAEM